MAARKIIYDTCWQKTRGSAEDSEAGAPPQPDLDVVQDALANRAV
jgi:hypothetical protein